MIPIYVGLDPRERIVHHVFQCSVARRTKQAVSFSPLSQADRRDASTTFAYARFLVPFLSGFSGWAIYADGDMVCRSDIADLWAMREERYAVMVAKHNYRTKSLTKMDGQSNPDYPRKNWSSLILWNCEHPANLTLTPDNIRCLSGESLHRFRWVPEEAVGSLPLEWNWLVGEYPHNDDARLLHYTLGAPCFPQYRNCDHSAAWFEELQLMSTPA